MTLVTLALYGPVDSKHSNQRSLLYAGSMAYLGRTTGRHRHGVEKGGGRGTGEGQIRGAGGTGTNGDQRGPTRQGTDKEWRWARRASWGKDREQGKSKTVGGVP